MKSKIFLSIFLIALHFSCEKSTEDSFLENPKLKTTEAKAFIAQTNESAFNFFRTIAYNEDAKNYMVSPISLSMALGMVHNGAAGETKTAFDAVLGGATLEENNDYNSLLIETLSSDSRGNTLDLANAIWFQEGFPVEKGFFDINKRFYKSEIANLDFSSSSAVKKVNDWAEANTNGKIKDLVESFDADTKLFIANAIYFKSQWKFRFDPDRTVQRPFYTSETNITNVSIMNMTAEVATVYTDFFSALALPYEDNRFEMVILLPNVGFTTNSIIENLDATAFGTLFDDNQKRELEIGLPRFKLEYSKSLNNILTELGLGIAFTANADFSGMNKDTGLFISDVFQKTFIEVNEEGTEASAVTGVVLVNTSVSPNFIADRPFLYIIREKFTGVICFMGRVGNPNG